jgi:hypothetical protein
MAQEIEIKEGLANLKELKKTADSNTAVAVSAPGSASDANRPPQAVNGPATPAGEYKGANKRRSQRYKCEGSAEVRADGSDVRTWAIFTDVSLHGCYVEAQATYPVGTMLHMKLEANGIRLESKGSVRVMYPNLGMGIAFVEMSEENMSHLKRMLAAIMRPSVVMGPGIASTLPAASPLAAVPIITDPLAAIRALIEFFENRQMLMRDDFVRIIKQSQK